MKFQFIIFSTLMMFTSLQAQQTITGKIVSKENQPLAFVNIILMNADSTFITGGVSDDNGAFRIPLQESTALLKISYLGYETLTLPIQTERLDMGNIILQEDVQMLNEVVIKGYLPKTRIKGDAMVTTVAGSLLEKAGTALGVLSKVPGITQKGEDINIFGRGTPQIYINGREVRDRSELDQLTSENIQSVEVVTNPGARYDKTVKAVIRILTKKPADDGFGFADRANIDYNDKWSYLNQLDLYYRQNKLDMTGMFAYSDQSSWRRINATQPTYLDHYWEQQMRSKQAFSSRRLTANIALNYTLNSDHSLGANFRHSRYPKSTNDMLLQTQINQDYSFFEKSLGDVGSESAETREEGNIYYNGKVKKWNIDFNGTWVHTNGDVAMATVENVENVQNENTSNSVHAFSDTRNTLYAGKLALLYPLSNGSLSFGSEYTHTSRTSLYQNNEGIVANDDSQIKEGLAATYSEYERAFGKVKMQAGLRFENVRFDYYQENIHKKEQSKNYNNWFPTLSVSIPIGKVQTQLSYASDITRPGYQMLRNRIDYVNRYTYESGNPFLLPAITQTLAFKAVYKWWQLYADLQHKKNAIIPYSTTYSNEDPTIALMSFENASAYNAMNLMLNAAPTIGLWSPQFSLEMYKQWYTVEEPGNSNGTLSLDRPSFSARWKNGFELPLGFILNADLQWEGRTDRDNISYKAVWWADASLYKDLFDSRLTFLLEANDIFNTYRNDYFMYYGSLRTMNLNEKYSRRSIELTIRYKFNIKKSKYKGTGAGDAQKYRL
jgi:hypothetical protein